MLALYAEWRKLILLTGLINAAGEISFENDEQMQSSASISPHAALFIANYSRFINVRVCVMPANDEQFWVKQSDF
jgi:hypothetical protein